MNNTWPQGAITGTSIKRDIPNECALAFARRSFQESEEAEWSTIAHLRRWFEDEWNGGGVELENWAEVSAIVVLLFDAALGEEEQ